MKNNEIEPLPPNRIEFLPIQWYEKVHGNSSNVKKSVNAATLKTIPLMRSFVNDVVFDVMMYLTPEYCQKILEFVIGHINNNLQKLMEINTEFDPFDEADGSCKCSIIGHSLGSVIVWDILSALKADIDSAENGNEESLIEEESLNQNKVEMPIWGPSLSTPLKETLMFTPGEYNSGHGPRFISNSSFAKTLFYFLVLL